MQTQSKITLALSILSVVLANSAWSSEQESRLISPLKEKPEGSESQLQVSPYWYAAPVGYEPRRKDKRSVRGKVLYQQHKCASCHSIDGQGGETGPPLDGIGAHRGREWLVARLLDPKKQMEEFPEVFGGKPCLMPHPGVTTAAAKLLADYLLTIEEPKAGFRVSGHSRQVDDVSKSTIDGDETWQPQPESQAVQSGKEAFISLHCGACHSLDGSGGRFAPDLSGIRSRRNSKELEKILSGAVGSSVMKRQAQSLGDDQIYDLKAFLLTIPKAK